MPETMLIFNPASDRGRSGQKASDLQAIVERRGGATWAGTEYPGHAVELAEIAARAGYERVVAMGGDGTVHEVINGLMRVPAASRPALGVVPIGSGNDFAFSSNLQMHSPAAMERIFAGETRPTDLARITDGTGRSAYLDNSAGFLFDAAVNIQSRKITRIYGFLLYLTATIRSIIENYDATHLKFNIDGVEMERDLLLFTVGNGAREGGGFLVTPQARNDDGLLDYCMVDPISRPMMFRLLPIVMQGQHERFPFVNLNTFRSLSFEADRAVPIHLDGELWAPYELDVRQVKIEVLPAEINLII